MKSKLNLIKKDLWLLGTMCFVGITAFILGMFGTLKDVMFGIASGFFPVSAISIGLLLYATFKNKKLYKNIELEKEERLVFIATKAGNTAFWVMYWYIFVYTTFSHLLKFTNVQFGVFTLIFMPVLYFGLKFIYRKKILS